MMTSLATDSIRLFTTCPPQTGVDASAYIKSVCEVSRWSDEAGYEGILVYTDNGLLDPWLLAQVIIENTNSLAPLIAVQPSYMHPYSAAKMVSTFGYLYKRRVCLNMVAGGFKKDLIALNDRTPHDERYARLIEYTTIIQRLLSEAAPLTFEGKFYQTQLLSLKPYLAKELFPTITLSGSSAAGLEAAHRLQAIPVLYPEPPDRVTVPINLQDSGFGIRIGVIARQHEDDAWHIAENRFPPDRAGQIAHTLAMNVSDSVWHRTLSSVAGQISDRRTTYWLLPFEHYKTFCPYLVGNYTQIAEYLSQYVSAGCRTYILDVPWSQEDLAHVTIAFDYARERASL